MKENGNISHYGKKSAKITKHYSNEKKPILQSITRGNQKLMQLADFISMLLKIDETP